MAKGYASRHARTLGPLISQNDNYQLIERILSDFREDVVQRTDIVEMVSTSLCSATMLSLFTVATLFRIT